MVIIPVLDTYRKRRSVWLISLRIPWRAGDDYVPDPRFTMLVSIRVCVVFDLEVRIIEPN